MDDTHDERPRRASADLSAGDRVGRYRLVRELGAGGMGVVWLARDPVLHRNVAIKFLRADAAGHADERFLREARAMARLSHPGVVSVFDIGGATDRAFFTMEYVEGTTLARWLGESPRTWREIVEAFLTAARGLAAAHAAGLVHRDFKPSNVLVSRDGAVKVADFGIASTIAEPSGPVTAFTALGPGLTNPGSTPGTPGYMAPEVLAGDIAGPEADQFAFAVSLRGALATARDAGAASGDLAAIIARALEPDTRARYPSMQLLIGALQRVLAPEGPKELKFGMPPSGDKLSAKRQHTAHLARVLEERFGVRLGVSFAADYRGLVEDLVAGRLDAAWLSPLSLLRAERQVRPVLVMGRGGRTGYHGALCARRDSEIVGIADLRGKRLAWVDEDSAAGYLYARALIAEQHPDVDRFLGPQQILGSHRAVVEAVLNGWVDAGATFLNFGPDGSIIRSGWREFLGERADEVGPVAISVAIPGDVIAVRYGLSREETSALVAALRDCASDPAYRPILAHTFNGTETFADPRPGEHDALAEYARRAGWRP